MKKVDRISRNKQWLTKLENYELQAYDGGFGSDWLEEVGEGLKLYINHCIENDESVTIEGFIRCVDEFANIRDLRGN